VENFLRQAGLDRVRSVLRDVIVKGLAKMVESSDVVLPARPEDIDSLNTDDMRLYRATRGKWKRDVLRALDEDKFWIALEISSRARQPLHHHHNFLLKPVDDDVRFAPGVYSGNQLCQLTCYKCQEIANEFCDLLQDSDGNCSSWLLAQWIDAGSIDDAIVGLELAVELVGHHAASYDRRCTQTLYECPGFDSFAQ
jgi:hypothetical protein